MRVRKGKFAVVHNPILIKYFLEEVVFFSLVHILPVNFFVKTVKLFFSNKKPGLNQK
jgi:hypothetical protein